MDVIGMYLPFPDDPFPDPRRRWLRARHLAEHGLRPCRARDDTLRKVEQLEPGGDFASSFIATVPGDEIEAVATFLLAALTATETVGGKAGGGFGRVTLQFKAEAFNAFNRFNAFSVRYNINPLDANGNFGSYLPSDAGASSGRCGIRRHGRFSLV